MDNSFNSNQDHSRRVTSRAHRRKLTFCRANHQQPVILDFFRSFFYFFQEEHICGVMIERKQESRSGGKEEGEISTNLQTETGLAPVPPLGVVAVKRELLAFCFSSLLFRISVVVRSEIFCCRRSSKLPNDIDSGISEVKEHLLYGVAGPQTNPLRNGTVLALGFSKLLLGAETLVALYTHFS